MCADVALAVRPRYHVAGGAGTFFTRPPYVNADLGAGAHATRFISLGQVGNAAKQKWLHALGLTPAASMAPEALTAIPPGTTACPYGAAGSRKRAADGPGEGDGDDDLGAQTWRWQERGKRPRGGAIAAPSLGRADVQKDKAKTAFVRNVPFRASEEDIIAFFSQAGTVEDVVRRANAEGDSTGCMHACTDHTTAVCQAGRKLVVVLHRCHSFLVLPAFLHACLSPSSFRCSLYPPAPFSLRRQAELLLSRAIL